MDELLKLKTCSMLHDIGKPECWANRKPWSHHIYYTHEIIAKTLGEEYAVTAMRHHTGASYSEEDRPRTKLERIICLADNLASGADRTEKPERDALLPKPPVTLSHILSDGTVVRKETDSNGLAYLTREVEEELSKVGKKTITAASYLEIFRFLEGSRLREIPADTRQPINDVSLWHHLKLTAAFATCIWLDGGYRGDRPEDYEFALLSGDGDRVSHYVDESVRLPDLNARSTRIKMATKAAAASVAEVLGPECLIYAGGGGFLALSPREKVEEAAGKAGQAFEAATDGKVTITVSHVEASGQEAQKNFGTVWAKAVQKMRLKKLDRPVAMPSPLEVGVEPCDVCHTWPATHEDRSETLPIDAAPRPEGLCDACWNLRGEGAGLPSLDVVRGATNYVAVLKADGDNMGEVLQGERFPHFKKSTTPSRLSAVSDLIHQTCEEKLRQTVQAYHGLCLFAGGDDVLAILAGRDALEAARKLAETFEEEMRGETMSAGVAVFHYKLPVYVGLEVAQELLSIAKSREKKNGVAYAIIGGSGLTPGELKERVKPSCWTELGEVLRIVEFMRRSDVAGGQLRRIAAVSKSNPTQAEALIKYSMGREIVPWSEGERLLIHLESGRLQEAFQVYNAFRRERGD